jgi:vacuolar-type H+-ATPase subunit D/Vma8
MCLSLIAAVASVIALTQNTLYYEFNTLSKEVFEYKRVSNNKWSEIDNNIKQIQSDLGNIKTKVWFQKKKIGTIENEITQLFDVVITIGNNIQIIKNAECNELFKDKILCNTDAFVEDFPISTQKD